MWGGSTYLRSQGGCLVLRTAVPRPVKQQLLVFREAGQHINPVQLRQCQGVVGQPQQPQSCHACMRKHTLSMHLWAPLRSVHTYAESLCWHHATVFAGGLRNYLKAGPLHVCWQ